MQGLPLATAQRIVRLATQAGLDVADLPNISPWAPELKPTALLEHLQQVILDRDPALAEELQAAAGIQGQPSLRLAAALAAREQAEANGWPVEPLEADLQREWDRLNPAAAAARRQEAEAQLIANWEQRTQELAQANTRTWADDPAHLAQLAASKKAADQARFRAAVGV
ncbi:hypothetical protein [Synechococcus sp. CBW1107]|uniref:hypothetical protein n=1 Tax=Synechococcus sp. CBW1107 TaxID=2789857 RepID=UPI002AD499EC|nr:hypothetical protein [Synechococcus sp. CBW1107]CAK6701030.1 hypothetical protein IFHNHDMJ_02986 [Synechococcus sp. CBW1107]